MKKILILFVLLLGTSVLVKAQCNQSNYATTLAIPLASFPYTNTNSVTVSATIVNANPLQNFTYNCGGNAYACSNPAWWLNSATGSITFTFSQPVCNLTIITNGTNINEEFYFASNNGPITLSNYCAAGFATILGGTGLRCTQNAATGTIISISNAAGATQYTITHSGTGAGSRISLLDCYTTTGCSSPSPTIACTVPNQAYCAGDTTTVTYNATGTFNAGNLFRAQLSDALGSFAVPTVIGAVSSTALSGGIPCTVPAAALTGAGYRIRVVSSNISVIGSDNGTNIIINQYPIVTASAAPNDTICAGDNVTLSGNGAVNYNWSAPVINNIPFTPGATATYTLIGSDAIGCSDTTTIEVVVNPNPVVTIAVSPNDSICQNEMVTLTASGTPTITWAGSVVNGVPFSPSNTATYTVTGTDANGCTDTESQTVTINPLPVFNLGSDAQICDGDSLVLNAAISGATYTWQDNSTNPTYTVKQTGNYSVAVDLNGCIATDNILVTVNPNPVIELGPDVTYCQGESIDIGNTCAGCTYLWDDNSVQAIRKINQEGTYTVTVTANNCSSTDNIFVDEIPLPIVDLGQDATICFGDEIVLDVSRTGGTYLWQDNSILPTYTIKDIGTYQVTVTENGCSSKDDKVITYDDDCDCPVYLPNAFSPNLDGRNDKFRLLNSVFIKLDYFKIYNRWGQEVFSTTNPTDSWDGKVNGVESPIGSYYWVVGYKCLYKNSDHAQRGDVTLIR